MKKYLIFLLISILILTSSCNKSKNTSGDLSSSEDIENSFDENTKTEEKQNSKGSGILQAYSIKKATKLYIEAANKVKNENIGFTKASWQKIDDIKTVDTTGLANKILDIILNNLVTSKETAFNNSIVVPKGHKERVMLHFPIFSQAYAVDLKNNYSCISSVDYKKEKGKYYITLYFKDIKNAEQGDGDFGSIMQAFKRSEILDFIKNYILFADLESLALDFLYYDSYLSCQIDASTMQLEKLDMHIKAHLDASAEFNVFNIVKTNVLNGSATITNNLHYYDFQW